MWYRRWEQVTMIEGPTEKANLDKAEEENPAGGSTHRPALRRVWMLIQAAGLAAAVAMGVHGSLILNEQTMRRFDEALVWYGCALLALAVFAWDRKLPRTEGGWRNFLTAFWSSHRLELLLVAAIFGFAIFMRTYKLDVFPPKNGLTFEEGINGGMAYRILDGERPLFYPVRYLNALGLWLLGDTTFGLRFFGIAMSIATVPMFYLLLRQLVRVPAALFGTALLAAAYWPSLVNRVTSATTFFTISLAYLFVRGMRTRSALMFMGVGVLAGLISYEYEDVKPVPFFVLGFLAALALWQIGGAARKGLRPALDAVLAISRKAWRPALAFVVAGGIVAGPLIVGTHLGKDPYLSSLHRQEADRQNRGTPGLFAPNWKQQAKWSTELFLPFRSGPPQVRLPLTMPGIPVADSVSGILIAAGVLYAAFTFFRPYRLLFLGWFVGTLGGGALLLSNWESWKFYGLMPIGFALAAFLVDDVRSLWVRLKPASRFSPTIFSAVLLGAAAYVFFWNADTLFRRIVGNPLALQEYTQTQSRWYDLCTYLRSLGKDNFTYTPQGGDSDLGFGKPHKSPLEQLGAWGDNVWVCHDLEGAALVGTQDSWPLRNVPSGKLALAFVIPPEALDALKGSVEQGYPDLRPDRIIEGPLSKFYVVGYVLSDDVVRSRQGLYGEYIAVGEAVPITKRVDKAHNISWAESDQSLKPPFTVRWRGLVYLDEGGQWILKANSADPAWISLDGGPPYAVSDPGNFSSFGSLRAGWHTLEIALQHESPGGVFSLQWASPSGAARPLEEQDLFAMESFGGWLHVSTFRLASGEKVVSQRIDHTVEGGGKRIAEAQASGGPTSKGTALVEELFSAWWSVPESEQLRLTLNYSGGQAAIYIDGKVVNRCDAGSNVAAQCAAAAQITSGDHLVEIRLIGKEEIPWSGARLYVSTAEGPLPEGTIEARPFR